MHKNYYLPIVVACFSIFTFNHKAKAQCTDPTGLSISNITPNTADFSWTVGGTNNFEVAVVATGAPTPTNGTLVTGGTHQFTMLAPATTYDAYVRTACAINDTLVISGVLDGTLTGGTPKVVELKVLIDIPDLSVYGIGIANNGGGSDGIEYTFPAVSASAGDYLYVTNDSTQFVAFLGFSTPYFDSQISNNGDDAVELFKDSVVIDLFGDINQDGTGQPWEFLDGWAYRNDNIPPSTTFNVTDWTYSGINVLDGATDNASSASPFPLGTYIGQDVYSNWVMTTFSTICDLTFGDTLNAPITLGTLVDTLEVSGSSATCFNDNRGEASADVFYQFIVDDPCVDSVTITTCGSNFDTQLTLFNELGATLDFDDNSATCGANLSLIHANVTVGDTLTVMVEGTATATGNFTLQIVAHTTVFNPTIDAITQVMCFGDSTGSVTMNDNSGDYSYVWDASTGNQVGQTATNLPAGNHGYTITNAAGCTYNGNITITQPAQALGLTYTTTDDSVGGNGAIDITPNGGTPSYNFSWNSGETTEDLSNLLAGDYTVTITDANGCQTMSTITVNSTLGITENTLNTKVSVFPNPSNGQFNIALGASDSKIKIVVTNAIGQKIQTFVSEGNETIAFDLKQPAGIYFVKLINENGTYQVPLVLN